MTQQLCLVCGQPIDDSAYYSLLWPGAQWGALKLSHAECGRNDEVLNLQTMNGPAIHAIVCRATVKLGNAPAAAWPLALRGRGK